MKSFKYRNNNFLDSTSVSHKKSLLSTTLDNLETDKIDKNLITIPMRNQKWYRVARLGNSSGLGISALLSINTFYNNMENSSFIFALNLTNNNAKISLISSLENVKYVVKTVRIVKDNNISYLEIFYNLNVFNNVTIEILNQSIAIEMLNLDTTDTITVLANLELYSNIENLSDKITNFNSLINSKNVELKRQGNIYFLSALINKNSNWATGDTFFKIPTEYMPMNSVICSVLGGASSKNQSISISNGGEVKINGDVTNSTWLNFNATWIK